MDHDVFASWDQGFALQDAHAAYDQGRYARAAELYERALEMSPGSVDAAVRLASSLQLASRYQEAARAATRAVELAPESARASVVAAGAKLSAGDYEGALRESKRAHELEPGSVQATLCRADLLRIGGRAGESLELLRQLAAGSGRDDPRVLAALSEHELPPDEAAETAEALAAHASDPDQPAGFRVISAFSAGRAFEKRGQTDRAFELFALGNELAGAGFDAAAHRRNVEAVIRAWPPARLESGPRAEGGGRPRVVFIIGMPRTGTTLVEQILSSHPDVFGGGEMRVMAGAVERLLAAGPDAPLTAVQLEEEASRAREAYAAAGGDHAVVTDKNLASFMHVGLIRSLFPDAPIIHCTRDPVDVSLSCWQRNFRGGLAWSRSFEGIAAFYRGHDDLTAHWRACGVEMLEVPYDELVRDPGAWSRRLVEHAGLAWDERCLRPHENARVALTSSNQQVRERIHPRASGRSERYGDRLTALREALRREGVLGPSSD